MMHRQSGRPQVVLLAATIFCACLQSPLDARLAPTASRPNLCGVKLRPAAEKVRLNVEQLTKHDVVCNTVSNLLPTTGDRAHSEMVNGVAVISVDVFMGRSETVITHELFHMQLWNQGFPMKFDVNSPRAPTAAERNTVKDLSSYLHHRLFFPKMKLMGLDPYEENEKEMENDFATEFVPVRVKADPNFLAVIFLPELDLPLSRRKHFEDGFKKMGRGDYIELSKKLHTLILQDNPTSAAASTITVEKCIRLMYR